MTDTTPPDIEIPPECRILKKAYRRSGLTAAEIADATGMSLATAHITMSGVRYRQGVAKRAAPPDGTLIKFASVLSVPAQALREVGRTRAADLLEEAYSAPPSTLPRALSERESQAAVAGRAALGAQILALFSTEELRAELARRGEDDDAEDADRAMREAAMSEIADLGGV